MEACDNGKWGNLREMGLTGHGGPPGIDWVNMVISGKPRWVWWTLGSVGLRRMV